MIRLSIVSADVKRELDKPLKLMKAINSQIEEQKRKKMIAEHKEKWIEKIFNTLKEDMETSTDCIRHTFELNEFPTSQDFYGKTYVLTECFEIVVQLLEEAGYETYFYQYSEQWQNRSGRFGYIDVSWKLKNT